jgi:protease PrsW
MDLSVLISAPIGFLPVVIFLVVLRYMDSYQLMSLRFIISLIVAGGITAIASYFINSAVLAATGVEFTVLTRYIAPIIEECLKASVFAVLLYRHRIGFLVDAAIAGFAVGAGFALIENLFYLQQGLVSNPSVWIVRGFGTALMHGGVTAIFAIVTQAIAERRLAMNPLLMIPGLFGAIALHSGFNHFFLSPLLHTVLVVMVLPPIMYLVFERSAASLHDWLQIDFDEDARILAQLNSGEFSDSRMGRFLTELKGKFEGPVVVDMLCYLRLYTELALRAKGILMMREHGIDPPLSEDIAGMLEELKFLEHSIGKSGVIMLQPLLHFSRKDLWQIYILKS